MGSIQSVVSTVTPALAAASSAVSNLLNAIRSILPGRNPTIFNIEESNRLHREREQRERAAHAAREEADRLRREAEAEARRAEEAKLDRERKRREAEEAREERRIKTAEAGDVVSATEDMAGDALGEMEDKKNEAEGPSDIAEGVVEEAPGLPQPAPYQNQDSRVEVARQAAEAALQTAEEETRQANAAKEEAEELLRKGIQPIVMPTVAELQEAKRKVEYREGMYHFAVAGNAGSGKSSLVNALCGLRNRAKGAAKTGITETTLRMFRFLDPNPQNRFVWYDVPGAGTLQVPDWQYFNNQALYVFDALIVLFDNRFTETDIAILSHARLFKIPCYIVRSKADVHIGNLVKEMEEMEDEDVKEDEDDWEGIDDPEGRKRKAKNDFVRGTRKNVRENLETAGLPDQRVYIVSNATLRTYVVTQGGDSTALNKAWEDVIDEVDFVHDVLGDAWKRRGKVSEESEKGTPMTIASSWGAALAM
ncbi:hypothetical protein CONPUDRAFT_169986 [Coniophora puteana RWD-64-598 SS2]|uniref:IRG-type G domain-containing protein n=1 Tax=Coniophora puteana (strain RWD-64-598) TaxID=741705 RepID=R7SFV8_CONPW|nr:uncharacterized protein CONPUDRAFT_169986 [Coniophora puteana RWD-64-598 SS2]EIW74627.1 hypothetical protein CONPUDRAFT_169986 [Coniophora puteana RWD-64-598 SS2]